MKNRVIFTFLFVFLFCYTTAYSLTNSTELYKKGVFFAKKKQFKKAIEFFKKSANRNPYYSLAHYGLGKSYLQVDGDIKKAIIHLERSIELDKNYSNAYFYLGFAYLFKKKYNKSIKNFLYSYKLDEAKNVGALYNVGVLYELLGKRRISLFYFSKYINRLSMDEDDF